MEKILFINSCIRENSRTKELAECVLDNISGNIHRIELSDENLKPLNAELLVKREKLSEKRDFSDKMFNCAKDFADADIIIIAAPYWDLTFPAVLKIYLEQISVSGITFRYINGIPHGLCRAKKLIYVTTSGGKIDYNFGFDYINTLARKFYGIEKVLLFKAENLDIDGSNVTEILEAEKIKINKFFECRGMED